VSYGVKMACLPPQARERKRYNCLSRRARVGKPQDSATTGRSVSEVCYGTRALAVWCEAFGGGGSVEQEQSMVPFGFFDVLVLAIGGHFVVKIVTTWLKTREGVRQRQVKQLEQRLHALETQQVADLHKRLSVLEEAFVLDDVALQRKLRQTLGDDLRAPASSSPNGRLPQYT
jgi:hypothetical protein